MLRGLAANLIHIRGLTLTKQLDEGLAFSFRIGPGLLLDKLEATTKEITSQAQV